MVGRLVRLGRKQARCVWKGWLMLRFTQALSAAVLAKLEQDLLGHRLERIEHSDSAIGDAFEHRFPFASKLGGEICGRNDVREVSLIELKHIRNLHQIITVLPQIGFQIEQRLDVRVHALSLRVRDEDHPVDALQDKLAACVVKDLTGHRVQVKPRLESANRAQVQRQKVEEQRSVGFSCQTNKLALGLRGGRVVNVLEIGGLAAQSGTIVNNLAIDLARCVVDKSQGLYPLSLRREAGAARGRSFRAGARSRAGGCRLAE